MPKKRPTLQHLLAVQGSCNPRCELFRDGAVAA